MVTCTKQKERMGELIDLYGFQNSSGRAMNWYDNLCYVIFHPTFSLFSDTREYALKQIEGTGLSMSACRQSVKLPRNGHLRSRCNLVCCSQGDCSSQGTEAHQCDQPPAGETLSIKKLKIGIYHCPSSRCFSHTQIEKCGCCLTTASTTSGTSLSITGRVGKNPEY